MRRAATRRTRGFGLGFVLLLLCAAPSAGAVNRPECISRASIDPASALPCDHGLTADGTRQEWHMQDRGRRIGFSFVLAPGEAPLLWGEQRPGPGSCVAHARSGVLRIRLEICPRAQSKLRATYWTTDGSDAQFEVQWQVLRVWHPG